MANPDIICLSISRWDSPISSPSLSLVKELSRYTRVFYIDHPYSVKDFLKERKSEPLLKRKNALLFKKNIYTDPAGMNGVRMVTPPLTIPINFLPEGNFYGILARLNNRLISNTVTRIIRENKIKKYLWINFYDPFYEVRFPENNKPQLRIYQSMDDISQEPYTARHGVRLEKEMIAKYELSLCTSRELVRIHSNDENNVVYFPNAADISLFNRAVNSKLAVPPELKEIRQQIIGFTGSIEYRTDFELLNKIAAAYPDKIVCLLGPIRTDEHILSGLSQRPNLMFIGARSIEELPAYLQRFDSVIIPYKINTLTRSIYPLKINEYLAAGKPVISTAFSEDIGQFSDVIYLAENHEDFIRKIDLALRENSTEKISQRVEFSKNSSWEKRAERFWELVRPFLQ